MAYGTYLRFTHRCDIYSRTSTVSAAGQRVPTFTAQKTSVPCEFQSGASERRVSPYIDNVDQYQLVVPKDYVSYFQYPSRVKNIKDRYGNLIESGDFEVVNIERKTGFNGKVTHLIVSMQLVVENA